MLRLVHQWPFLYCFDCVLAVFDCFWYSLGRPVTIGTPMVIFPVLTVFHCFLRLVHRWYSLGRPVTIGTPMVLSVFCDWSSVPFVKNSQKQSKDSQNSNNHHWCTNRHMSTQSQPNTQSRANAATLRNLHHMCLGSGDSPLPVIRVDCSYVSTWTSMCLAPVRCRVLLHSLLPTDDACSSYSLSTTVIKFSIFSDPTGKHSALLPEICTIR